MKTKIYLFLLFTSVQIINAQDTTPTPTPAPAAKKPSVGAKLLKKGLEILDQTLDDRSANQKTSTSTTSQQTISGGSRTAAPQTGNQPEAEGSPIPARTQPKGVPTSDTKPVEQAPVLTTTVNDIDEMPDLSQKIHDGIKYTVKQWQQIGQKVIIKMIIENNDAKNPMRGLGVNGQENTIYDSVGNTYKGTSTQVASFISKGGELVSVPLVFGAKSAATVEFNVGNAKIDKVVGLNFMFERFYGDNHYHFFVIK